MIATIHNKRKPAIDEVLAMLPPYITMIPESYVGLSTKAEFIDTEYKQSFSATPSHVISGRSVCKLRSKHNYNKTIQNKDGYISLEMIKHTCSTMNFKEPTELSKYNMRMYKRMIDNGWKLQCFPNAYTRKRYSNEEILNELKKYNTITELRSINPRMYAIAKQRALLYKVFDSPTVNKDKITNMLIDICKNYKSITELRFHELHIYTMVCYRKMQDICFAHMVKRQSGSRGQNICKQILIHILKCPVLENSRKILGSRLELDIYIEKYKFAVEYNGLYFHSDEEQIKIDNMKHDICKNKGITLITINENPNTKHDINLEIDYIKTEIKNNLSLINDICGASITDAIIDEYQVNIADALSRHYNLDDIETALKASSCYMEFRLKYRKYESFIMRNRIPKFMELLAALPRGKKYKGPETAQQSVN